MTTFFIQIYTLRTNIQALLRNPVLIFSAAALENKSFLLKFKTEEIN
jgi:hypothetical protein